MGLSTSLVVDEVLRSALTTLLRRLGCSAGVAFSADASVSVQVPRGAVFEITGSERALAARAAAERASDVVVVSDAGVHRHAFGLPQFGSLVLEKRGEPLDPAVVRAVRPVMQRLGVAARACTDHAALQASEARYAGLAASLPEVVFDAEGDGDGALFFHYVSPRSTALLGVDPSALVADAGRWLATLDGADRDALRAAVRESCGAVTPVQVTVREPAHDRWFRLEADSRRVAPDRVRLSGLILDVTAQRRLARAEEAAARARFARVLGAVDDAIVAADAAGAITEWNQAAERLFGWSTRDAVGRPLVSLLPPSLRMGVESALSQEGDALATVAGAAPTIFGRSFEMLVERAGGVAAPVELVLSCVNEGGERYFIGVFRDIWLRRQREAEDARATEEQRRFASALLRLGAMSADALPAFKQAVTEVVSDSIGAVTVGLWRVEPTGLVARDLFVTGDHLVGQVYRGPALSGYLSRLAAEDALSDGLPPLPGARGFGAGPVIELHLSIQTGGDVVGALTVAARPRDWRPAERRFLSDVAQLVARTLERASRRRAEARYTAVLQSIGDALIGCDAARQVVSLNGVAEALTGLAIGDAIGRPVEEVLGLTALQHGGVARQLRDALARAMATGGVVTVEYARSFGSESQTVEARVARLADDEAIVVLRDMTADRRREAELRRERERFEAVLATTSAILYTARLPQMQLDYISESVSSILGYRSDEALQPGFREGVIHPDDRERVLRGVAVLQLIGRHALEYRMLHRDGSFRWLRHELRVLGDDHGAPTSVVGAAFDITDRKAVEAHVSALSTVQGAVARLSTSLLGTGASRSSSDGIFTREIVRSALRDVGEVLRADRASVFQLQGNQTDNTHEWCSALAVARQPQLQGLDLSAFAALLAPIREGRHLYLGPSMASTFDRSILDKSGISTLLVVPMRQRGALRGFIAVENPQLAEPHVEEFATMLGVMADTIATGERRAEDEAALRQLNDRLADQAERQRHLLEVSYDLASARTRDALLSAMERHIRSLFGIHRVTVTESVGDDWFLVRVLNEPGSRGQAAALGWERLHLPGTAVAHALRTGRTLTTRDYPLDHFPDWKRLSARDGYLQFVMVPLLGPDGPLGTLNLSVLDDHPFSAEQLDAIAQVGSLLAAHLVLHNARDAIAALNTDLEQRVVARTRELAESEARFAVLFREAPQAMLIVDGDRRVVQSNRHAQRLFGYDERDFAALPVTAVLPDGAAADASVGLRRDGERFAAEVGVVPLMIGGQPRFIAGISDISARVVAQEAVVRSLQEKETLLKEIHHRVKNNLQIVSSMLMLQSDQMPSEEARRMLAESVYRVRSMALIHQQLYGVDSLAWIDVGDYARTLAEQLRGTLAPMARLHVAVERAEMTVDYAVPLGLILNELLTNAFKYGLSSGRVVQSDAWDVCVEVLRDDHRVTVRVSDRGPGLPAGFNPARATSLGLHLVRSLSRQLRAELQFGAAFDDLSGEAPGTRFSLSVPMPR